MDDKGFIFTLDASLALIVVIVLTATIVSYTLLPYYEGEDHQHLEAIASSALEVMEQDGTLNVAAVDAATGNTTGAQKVLHDRLESLIPGGIGFNITLKDNNVVSDQDSRGLVYSTDQVTKVKVISAPNEGWQGRSWYKVDNLTFVNQSLSATTTLWNFHNWLSNFAPWSGGSYSIGSYPYWGYYSSKSAMNINFSAPSGTYTSAKFLVGSDSYSSGNSYAGNLTINGNKIPFYTIKPGQTGYLGPKSNANTQFMYNYLGNISASYILDGDVNSFNVAFTNMSSHEYDMPWFSIIANYTTSILVPQGIYYNVSYFANAGGLAVQTATNLTGGNSKNQYQLIYDPNSGTVSAGTYSRVITWANFYNKNAVDSQGNSYDNGVPFVITGANSANSGITSILTAVSTTANVYIPPGNTTLDSYVVVNAYGAEDGALVEVWNGTTWNTIFNSFDVGGVDYSGVSDGYGNIPGIIYIPSYLLPPGQNNKVRVTTWDDVPGGDYDLVGLTDCYVSTCYSPISIGWNDTPFDSYQSSNNVETETKSFTVNPDATLAYLFVGAGLDTQNVVVKYSNNSKVLYNGSVPYYLDLASLDASTGIHYITTPSSTGTNYTLSPGTYSLTVSVTSYKDGWESGDANAELFSGTRIAVIYPALYNLWYEGYSNNATIAQQQAYSNLVNFLNTNHITYDASKISNQTIWAGGLPNQATVRLNLWKQ
jgi:hypothetical protein